MNHFDCLEAGYDLLGDLRGPLRRIRQVDTRLHTQLRTAALSIPLNVAEGRGRTGKDRVHHWRIAHGSAEEVVAILRSAERLGDLAPRDCATAHATLTRLCQMLWRMTR